MIARWIERYEGRRYLRKTRITKAEARYWKERMSAECPRTRFPDGTHCGEYGWHAQNCPERTTPTAVIVALLTQHQAGSGASCRCGWTADRSVAFETGRDVPTQYRTHVAECILIALSINSLVEESTRE